MSAPMVILYVTKMQRVWTQMEVTSVFVTKAIQEMDHFV